MADASSSDKTVTQILHLLSSHPELQSELDRFRRTITVMFTDIKGSTAYFDKYGDAAGLAMVHACNELQVQRIVANSGKVIKTIGDAVMATFESPDQGVTAAIEMQHDLTRHNASRAEEDRTFLRIGLHLGQGIVKSNDVFGDVVNVASRIQSAAMPEQILISDAVLNQLSAERFTVRPLGRFAFKGKGGEQDLYEIAWTERASPSPVSGHTMVISSAADEALQYALQHVRRDGSLGNRYPVPPNGVTIGRNNGDIQFPEDDRLAVTHARVARQGDQLLVEDLSDGHELMVRLTEPYLLQDGEVLKIGRQVFRFAEVGEAIAAAANAGTTIGQLSTMIKGPAVALQRLNPHGPDATVHFPITADLIVIGRERGDYVFPDDGFMSRSHAKVYQRGENFFVEDLGSRNGTFVKVHGKAPLPAKSALLVGRQLFRVEQI